MPIFEEPPYSLDKHPFYGLKLDLRQKEFRDAIWSPDKLIIFSDSKAGTGKTTIAVAVANLLVKYGRYDGLTYIVSPCAESQMGYLPGDVSAKVAVYGTPLYQALIECNEMPERAIYPGGASGYSEGSWVEFIAHTHLRGANLKNQVVIIEEAQNYSFHDLKKTLTRCHDSAKVIVIGHSGQRDAFTGGESAFSRYITHFEGDPRTAICNLTKNYRGWISSHADDLN